MLACRYAAGDKVEAWLLELLCLNAAEHVPKLPARLPHPSECDLYYINRDTLFSYHKVSHCCTPLQLVEQSGAAARRSNPSESACALPVNYGFELCAI